MLSFLSRPNAESKSDPPTPRSLTPRADESRRSKIKGLFFVELTWNNLALHLQLCRYIDFE